jgi:glutathione S-transferase
VPVLVLPDGRVIDESIEIMRWALGRNDPEDWLSGDDAALIAANDGAFKHHLDRYKYPDRHGSDASAARSAAMAMLEELMPGSRTRPISAGSAGRSPTPR